MNAKLKKALIFSIELTLVLLAAFLSPVVPRSSWNWLGSWANLLALACVVIGGFPVLVSTVKALLEKDLTADLLFLVALGATVYLGRANHVVAATLVLMMGSGELIEEWTVDKTYEGTNALLDLEPLVALLRVGDSNQFETREVNITEINVGDVVVTRSGDRVPVDGTIVHGTAELDASLITGEHQPLLLTKGEEVSAGMLVIDGALHIKTSKQAARSSISQIAALVREARHDKSRLQAVTDKWAQVFAPLIITISLLTWIFTRNILYTISVLLVSCPCSLVLSVPTAFIGALGNAARRAIWFRSGKVLETIGRTNLLVLDKTGTLTYGIPMVDEIESTGAMEMRDLEMIIHSMEVNSSHPAARSICMHLGEIRPEARLLAVSDFTNLPGTGIKGEIKGFGTIYIGNARLMENLKVLVSRKENTDGTSPYRVFVSTKDILLGTVTFKDEPRKGLTREMNRLRDLDIKNIALVTGDSKEAARRMASLIDADLAFGDMSPGQKLEFIKEAQDNGAIVTMVGDGINDAPALAVANTGIAMGKAGAALATEQADVVLMDDDIAKVSYAIKLGQKCVRKAVVNIILAMLFNFAGIVLAISGLLVPIGASLWHVMQSLVVVSNSALLIRKIN